MFWACNQTLVKGYYHKWDSNHHLQMTSIITGRSNKPSWIERHPNIIGTSPNCVVVYWDYMASMNLNFRFLGLVKFFFKR